MMPNYAIVKNGVVINVVLWDGESEWAPDDGDAIITDGTVGIGWLYDGRVFTAPPLPPIQQEKLIAMAEQKKSGLLTEASTIIAPLADAQLGGYIDDADVPRLTAWQKYRYALTKVDTSTAPDIEWPVQPA